MEYIRYIDIEKQIQTSDSAFLKRLPRFVKGWIALIIRQDEINRILNKYSDVDGVDFLPRILEELNIRIEAEGLENLPDHGKCFFIANHPFGFVDGLILTSIVAARYGKLKAIGNELFFLIPQLKPIIAAVNAFGKSPRKYLSELNHVFNSDIPVTHFPSGRVSRVKRWKITDDTWHKSIITRSVLSKRDVVPLYFYGRNSSLFYSVFLIRKALGITTNLELALLPHEIFNKKNKPIKVKIGKPVPYQTFDHSKSQVEWTSDLMKRLYNLK